MQININGANRSTVKQTDRSSGECSTSRYPELHFQHVICRSYEKYIYFLRWASYENIFKWFFDYTNCRVATACCVWQLTDDLPRTYNCFAFAFAFS